MSSEVIVLGDSSDDEKEKATCPICFCDADSMCTFHCGHACCLDCAASFLTSKIEEGVVGERLRCFSVTPSCKERLRPADVRRALGKVKGGAALWDKFRARSLDVTEGVAPCPQPGCDFKFIREPREPRFTCPKCKIKSCLECGTRWHHGISHAANKARMATSGLLEFARANPGARVEKVSALRHAVRKDERVQPRGVSVQPALLLGLRKDPLLVWGSWIRRVKLR